MVKVNTISVWIDRIQYHFESGTKIEGKFKIGVFRIYQGHDNLIITAQTVPEVIAQLGRKHLLEEYDVSRLKKILEVVWSC